MAGLVAIVAALMPVGSASAVPPFRDLGDNTPFIEHAWVEFSGVEFDSQFTRVAAKVICPVDDFDPGGSTEACRGRVGVTWFLEGKGVKGPRRGLAAPRDMVIERGASEHYEVRIPSKELRNVLARAGGQALVGIGSVDPDTLYLQSNETLATPTFTPAKRTRWNSCGVQSFLRVAGGTLLEEIRDADGKVSFGPLYSPDIQILTRYRVVNGTARFTLNGLRHELSEGSEFSVWCAGLNALHQGKTFPTSTRQGRRQDLRPALHEAAVRRAGDDAGGVAGVTIPRARRHDGHAQQGAARVDTQDAQGTHRHGHAVAAAPRRLALHGGTCSPSTGGA